MTASAEDYEFRSRVIAKNSKGRGAKITACLNEVNNALFNGRIRKGIALKLFALLLEMRETEKERQEVLSEVREAGLYNKRISQKLYRKVKAITED